MSDEPQNHRDPRMPDQPGHEPPIASLLRAAADDELAPDQQAALDSHLAKHPGDAARIEFERRLRVRVGHAMATPDAAPDHLHQRIRAIAEQAHQTETPGTQPHAHDPDQPVGAAPATTPDPDEPETRARRFWADRARQVLAVAAAAILLLAAGLFISRIAATGPATPGAQARTELAGYVSSEHTRCLADSADVSRKFTASRNEVPALFESVFGTRPNLASLTDAGLRVIDAGKCGVPGESPSIHVRLKADHSGTLPPDTPVSLFAQHAAQAGIQLEADRAATFTARGSGAIDESAVFAWRADGLMYYLVAASREVCDQVRRVAGLPAPGPG